ncbi:MAG: hypothetical protein ACJA0B_000457 [Alcanivorax borkumensis]|jgi:hypothetical protein
MKNQRKAHSLLSAKRAEQNKGRQVARSAAHTAGQKRLRQQ